MATYSPEQLSAFWSAVGALATVAAAVVAIVTLLALRKDSRDRTRPMMGAFLRPDVLTNGVSELVIKNYGPTAATRVRVTFDPPLPKLEGTDADEQSTPFLQRRYAHEIPTIAPGMELANIYQTFQGDMCYEPLPNDFTIHFSYSDALGDHAYAESYALSVETLRNATGSYPSNTDDKGMRRRKVKALEAIARGIGRH
jgi:hypothetical protein